MATVRVPSRGEYRHIVKLENPVKYEDGAGGQNEQYQSWVTTRGVFRKKTGFRNLEEGFDQLVSEYECFLPWRNEFDNNMTKDTRLIYNNRFFKIVSKEYVDEKRSVVRLTLIEVE